MPTLTPLGYRTPAIRLTDTERDALAHLTDASNALAALRLALAHATHARAPKLSARIRLAISSARGAVRAAEYRYTRARIRTNQEA
jgi:hypothetical protein